MLFMLEGELTRDGEKWVNSIWSRIYAFLEASFAPSFVAFEMANKIPENYQHLEPTFTTPISDYFSLVSSRQGEPCGFFEANFYKCMEAYGAKLGRKYCDLEHRDYSECITRDKQEKRYKAIQAEWEKKYKEGKIDKKFSDHIQYGDFKPDYFRWNRIW
ncbi:unnamed protein product [Bursaphelenchus xylophilus]|uniref:(pine wood nematode) hypothetical protein n=1 Tax=Bursaphelenchus xylophilus TaxID=6326 RepID=A0A1I7S682_BURXY|nr:unnamed protein product [Bursaphelenchus xylophilus]CAG9081107.1 unnamed protein product [Bursaphelenchus xylophilus]